MPPLPPCVDEAYLKLGQLTASAYINPNADQSSSSVGVNPGTAPSPKPSPSPSLSPPPSLSPSTPTSGPGFPIVQSGGGGGGVSTGTLAAAVVASVVGLVLVLAVSALLIKHRALRAPKRDCELDAVMGKYLGSTGSSPQGGGGAATGGRGLARTQSARAEVTITLDTTAADGGAAGEDDRWSLNGTLLRSSKSQSYDNTAVSAVGSLFSGCFPGAPGMPLP